MRLGEKRTRGLYVVLVVGALLVAALTALDRPPALLAVASAIFATVPLQAVVKGARGRQLVPVLVATGQMAAGLRRAVCRGALARGSVHVVSAAMPTRYRREGPGIEFDRVAFFTDAVFAIAITLLVVEVGLPEVAEGLDRDSAANLLDATGTARGHHLVLRGCFAIGGYWLANHRFTARLGSIDPPQIAIVVLYLAFVAFLPFAVGTLGEYFSNPLSIAIFAVNLGIVSTMEVVLFWRAGRAELSTPRSRPTCSGGRMVMSASPVAVFALSIPIAFIRPWLGVLTWTLSVPLQILLGRWRPAELPRTSERPHQLRSVSQRRSTRRNASGRSRWAVWPAPGTASNGRLGRSPGPSAGRWRRTWRRARRRRTSTGMAEHAEAVPQRLLGAGAGQAQADDARPAARVGRRSATTRIAGASPANSGRASHRRRTRPTPSPPGRRPGPRRRPGGPPARASSAMPACRAEEHEALDHVGSVEGEAAGTRRPPIE